MDFEKNITSQNETFVDLFQPTCSICTFELFKLGPDSILRGYVKPEQRLSGMDEVIHPDRYRDRTAIDLIEGCGHLAHVSCLNLHFGQRLANFMEKVYIINPNAVPPLPKCGCGQIIPNDTQKACFPGYEERGILLNSPQVEKHVENSRSENRLEIEVLRVLEMDGNTTHLHVNHTNFDSNIHDTSISISHPRNWVSSSPPISEERLIDFLAICEISDETDLVFDRTSPEKIKLILNQSDVYFGTEKEVTDVKAFLAEYGKTNIMIVVIRLTQILSEKTEMEWPAELAPEYISLYALYRSHVLRPNLFPEDEDELAFDHLRSDSVIILTMLELLLDNTAILSIPELSQDDRFFTELHQLKQGLISLGNRILLLRLNWLLARYHLLLANANGFSIGFEDAVYYLNEIEKDMHFDPMTIKISTRLDNMICTEEVKKKLSFVNRMENVNRIHELYKSKQFEDLIEILNFSLNSEDVTSTDFTNRLYLAESYCHVEKFIECLEECLKIINSVTCGKNRDSEILTKTMTMLEDICVVKYKSQTCILPMKLRKSVVQSMFKLLVFNEKELKSLTVGNKGSPMASITIPWCVLHNILYQLEFQESALYLDDEAVPNSILLLQFAHECVSLSASNCLLENGKLLLYTVEELVRLKSMQGIHFEYEETKHCVEQSIFCLYGHPSRKSKLRHLNDHNTGSGIMLEWDKCLHLYEYYKPDELPEFDSYDSISADVEGLFQRILAAMATDLKPTEVFQNIKDYLDGKLEEIEFDAKNANFPFSYSDIFYLIGDHHFKSKEWTKAVDNYTWDLAVTHRRFDSWAAIALAKGEMINFRLNSCDNFSIDEVVSNANTVVNCFRQALNLEPGNTKIRIEFGSFVYAMHSFCSRLLKQSADLLSMDKFSLIESKKDEFLASAAKCFESMATKVNHSDELLLATSQQEEERWIHHYMLGKVFEKLDPNDAEKFLAQYELAAERLHQQGASYPSKISFYNPPELAVEALEIYYRIHSSVLNYIEKHEYNSAMDQILTKYLLVAASSPFMKLKTIRGGESSESRKKKELQDTADVTFTMEYILNSVENRIKEDQVFQTLESPDDSEVSTIGTSLDDDSSDSSIEIEFSDYPPPVISYGLSAFKEKMRDKEVRGTSRDSSTVEKSADTTSSNKEQRVAVDCQTKASESVSEFVDMNLHFKDNKYGHLISQCVSALEECISRFPAHHKSFYRLSYTYSVFANTKSNNKICKEWLLGCGPLDKKKICGLFSDRKPNNFFNCVWRNPIDDIDRPGSFPYHMSKTISHLLTVLDILNDHEMLAEIAIQLSKVPDTDKKYLYNFEREQYSQQAFISCVASAKRFLLENKNRIQDAAMSIFTSYVKLQKFNAKENVMSGILLDAYKLHLESKGMSSSSLTIDQAFRFYQHLAWTTKIQNTTKCSSASNKTTSTITNTSTEGGTTKIEASGSRVETYSMGSSPKTRTTPRIAWSQSQQRMSTGVSNNYSASVVSCANQSYQKSSNKPLEGKNEAPYSNSIGEHGQVKSVILATIEVNSLPIKKATLKTGKSVQGILPSDLSKRSENSTFVERAALKPNINISKDSGTIPEIMPSRPTFVGISKSPWIPNVAETPGFYSAHPSSFSTSTNTTSVIGLPKIFSNPSFANLSAQTNLKLSSVQQSGAPTSLVNLSTVPRRKDTKFKRKMNTTNTPDSKRIRLSESPNTWKKRPAIRDKSILQDCTPAISVSIIPTLSLNTSPFKAQQNIMSQPDWSLRQLERNHENPSSPPAAHSQSVNSSALKLINYVDQSDSVEIIDLTTKTPEKVNPLDVGSPEKEIKRHVPRGTPEITLVNLDAVLGKSSLYPLPPKKKHTKTSHIDFTREK